MKLNKKVATIVSLALLGVAAVAGTVAYIFTNTELVENTFAPADVTSKVEEKLEDNVKNNVKITNTGNVDAFIRAKVVFTWENEEGQVHSTPVNASDYNITWSGLQSVDGKEPTWFEKDGFYYHKADVDPQGSTSVLFTNCSVVADKAPAGYSLHVEIIAEAIQADGVEGTTPAVEKAWKNVEVASGKLQPKTSTQGQ